MNTLTKMNFIVFIVLIFMVSISGQKYNLTADSFPQEGVPKGTVTEHTLNKSSNYPGSTHHHWVYAPTQHDESNPACVMVFQDGADFVHPKGEVRVPTVFDNLIHRGEIPVTIVIWRGKT